VGSADGATTTSDVALNGPLVVGLCAAAISLATRRVADSDRRPCEIVSSNTRDSQAEARTLKELLDDVR